MKVVDFEVVAVIMQAHEVKQVIAIGPALGSASWPTAKLQSITVATIG
jgi:hypothetical protein